MKRINKTVLKDGSIASEIVEGNKRIIFIKSVTGNDKVKEAMQVVLKDRYDLKK